MKTILLVDDDASVRYVVGRLLESNGYRVLEADSGLAALELWRTHSEEIDLLFTDLQMPEMEGPQLAAVLRALNPALRVVYTSGSGISTVEAMLNSAQPGRFVAKPYRTEVLINTVSEALV
jgi:CheY-like chemotaxis protein